MYGEGQRRPNSYTQCIFENSNREIIDSSVAELSPKDNYNRALGRVITLKRLLRRLNVTFRPLTKEERTYIWNCYKEMTSPKTQNKKLQNV